MLYNNQLRGNVPGEIGLLDKLTDLRIYENQLSGKFPRAICKLTKLRVIFMYRNHFTGMYYYGAALKYQKFQIKHAVCLMCANTCRSVAAVLTTTVPECIRWGNFCMESDTPCLYVGFLLFSKNHL